VLRRNLEVVHLSDQLISIQNRYTSEDQSEHECGIASVLYSFVCCVPVCCFLLLLCSCSLPCSCSCCPCSVPAAPAVPPSSAAPAPLLSLLLLAPAAPHPPAVLLLLFCCSCLYLRCACLPHMYCLTYTACTHTVSHFTPTLILHYT
jgi:hypothetical protein